MRTAQDTHKLGLSISNISCNGLPRVGKYLKHKGSFYIEATINEITSRTNESNPSDDPSWGDTTLEFDLKGGGHLNVQVMYKHRRSGKQELIGAMTLPIENTSDSQGPQNFLNKDIVLEKKYKGASTISFTLTRMEHADRLEAVREQMDLAAAGASKITKATRVENSLGQLSGADKAIETVKKAVDPWKSLLKKIEIVVAVGNKLAQIHPYAQMVWSVLSPVLEAIKEQGERDERIVGLLGVMDHAYFFVDVMKPLEIEGLDDAREEILKQMLQQTYDCAWFIRGYTSLGFFGRGVAGMTTSHDKIVEQYTATFRKLEECYKTRSFMKIELTIHRTLAVVQDIRDNLILDDMAFAVDRDSPDECLPQTRERLLEEIMEWINRPSPSPEKPEPCVFWLHGVAGCGKSTIASTIAQRFNDVKRCSWFFFSASKESDAKPQYMFSTLSRTFADMDAKWRESLAEITASSKQLRTTRNVRQQFERFILEPAKEFEPMGPIVVVIDALDESGSKGDTGRKQLLEMLGRLHELSSHGQFRFLITSRPEEDIMKVFDNKPWAVSRSLTNVDESSTDNDIRIYVESQLSKNLEFPLSKLTQKFNENPVDLIVERAGHLFQWAAVVCGFITGAQVHGAKAVDRYAYLRNHPTDARLGNRLDTLYTTILQNLYGLGDEEDVLVRFRKVLGRIFSAREPLSLRALTELRAEDEDEDEMEVIVRSLGSLLKGVDNENRHEPIQPLHVSFKEFLCDPARSRKFHVETRSEDAILARSSLRVMNEQLRFNICNLESSYLRNREVENLPNRVKQNIPECLSYACRYFADHLSGWKDDDARKWIKEFMSNKFLFWLEVLSLIKNTSQGLTELLVLQEWVQKNAVGEDVKSLIDDAVRFIQAYGGMMEMSTPHIYLSLLAFIPTESPLHEAYTSHYPGGLKVAQNNGQRVKWTSMLSQIQTSSGVQAVAFSPNGKLIVSGSRDSTVRVWDVHTGKPVGDAFQGHTSWVNSVGFSPDGKLVVSGSHDSTVRVWDVHTGQPVGDAFRGHTSWVNSVGFSPDGKLVVSGSSDSTVRVWDVHTGKPAGNPLQGHTLSVSSVGFSPNSNLIVSGSGDKTIRVCDIQCKNSLSLPDSGQLNNILHYTNSSIFDDNGWIQGQSGELLFWVPPSYRACLWRPGNIAVIGRDSVKLDFSRFTHGIDWHQCNKL